MYRGDNAVAAAAMLLALDPRIATWADTAVHPSRSPHVSTSAGYLIFRMVASCSSCLGVSPARPTTGPCSHTASFRPAKAPSRS